MSKAYIQILDMQDDGSLGEVDYSVNLLTGQVFDGSASDDYDPADELIIHEAREEALIAAIASLYGDPLKVKVTIEYLEHLG